MHSGSFGQVFVSTEIFEHIFEGQFCLNWAEMWKNVLQRPYLKLNFKVFRLSNFANPSSFGKVIKIGKKNNESHPIFEAQFCLKWAEMWKNEL